MSRSRVLVIALAFGSILLPANQPVRAQGADHALLSAFCNAADIAGPVCKRARGYPNAGGKACDVKLAGDRYSGRFTASDNPVLVVAYESGCEAHATDSGGAILFELSGDKYVFKSYQPGSQAN